MRQKRIPMRMCTGCGEMKPKKELVRVVKAPDLKNEAGEIVEPGAVSLEVAKKIVELRDQLGSFQSYDDLNELELPKDQMDKLRWNTTIQGIASDCNC